MPERQELHDTCDHPDEDQHPSAKHRSSNRTGIVTKTLETKLPAAKKMLVFCNNDPWDQGHKFVLVEHDFKTWDSVLTQWTKSIAPKFGAITRVFTPVHGGEIHSMDELQDNGVYIAASGANQRHKNSKFPAGQADGDAVRRAFRRDKLLRRYMPVKNSVLVQRSSTLPPLENHGKGARLIVLPIHVCKNGDFVYPAVRIVLTGYDLFCIPRVLDVVCQKVRPINGAVKRLVTLSGRTVKHVQDLEPNGYYVALGVNEKFDKRCPYKAHGVPFRDHKTAIIKAPRVWNFKTRPFDPYRYPISKYLRLNAITTLPATPTHHHQEKPQRQSKTTTKVKDDQKFTSPEKPVPKNYNQKFAKSAHTHGQESNAPESSKFVTYSPGEGPAAERTKQPIGSDHRNATTKHTREVTATKRNTSQERHDAPPKASERENNQYKVSDSQRSEVTESSRNSSQEPRDEHPKSSDHVKDQHKVSDKESSKVTVIERNSFHGSRGEGQHPKVSDRHSSGSKTAKSNHLQEDTNEHRAVSVESGPETFLDYSQEVNNDERPNVPSKQIQRTTKSSSHADNYES